MAKNTLTEHEIMEAFELAVLEEISFSEAKAYILRQKEAARLEKINHQILDNIIW